MITGDRHRCIRTIGNQFTEEDTKETFYQRYRQTKLYTGNTFVVTIDWHLFYHHNRKATVLASQETGNHLSSQETGNHFVTTIEKGTFFSSL